MGTALLLCGCALAVVAVALPASAGRQLITVVDDAVEATLTAGALLAFFDLPRWLHSPSER